MRIGIYGRGLQNRAGIGRYTRGLLRAMLAEPRGHEIFIFVGEGQEVDEALRPAVVPLRGSGHRLVEEQLTLPRVARRLGLDLFFNPDFTLPFLPTGARREVVTVHDAAYRRYPESNSRNSRLLLGASMPTTLRRADAVIANSEFTKREFVSLYRVSPAKILPIPLGIEPSFKPASVEEIARVRARYGLPERFVLAVGSIEPRKNFGQLAEAVAGVPGVPLVIGGGDARGAAEIRGRVRGRLGERAQFLGFVPDGDAVALFSAATILVYPSIYEGFGFPPLEAMACGTPTLVSRAGSVPEVAGDAAETFDPWDIQELREKLAALLGDKGQLGELRARGLRRAREFTWAETARRTFEVFEGLGQARD